MENNVIAAELGSSDWFAQQEKLIQNRPLVKYCYDVWYEQQVEDFNSVAGKDAYPSIELGSGGSYLHRFIPGLLRTDVVARDGVSVVDAQILPYKDKSLSVIFMSHVLHHIPDVRKFLREAERTLISGGVISMIEVAHTPLAKIIFKNFHTEPYVDTAKEWKFDSKHNMDANQALSWIVFFRDKEIFQREFPNLVMERHSFLPWLGYLLSGGVTKPQLLPTFLAPFIIILDKLVRFMDPICSLHWHIRIRRK